MYVQRRSLLWGLILALLAVAGGCSSGPDARQQPSISVGAGLSPTISWSPQGAATVRVHRGTYQPGGGYVSEDIVWGVESRGGNSIQSPLTYGAEVPGAQLIQAAQALVPGETYTVYVHRTDPQNLQQGFTGSNTIYHSTQVFTAGP